MSSLSSSTTFSYANLYNNIFDFDIFIFDFDGTIMNTEYTHCKAWNIAINDFFNNNNDNKINISINDYFKYFHSLDNKFSRMFLNIKYDFDISYYEDLYKKKQIIYNNLIKTEHLLLMPFCFSFLDLLVQNNKKFIIVTNTSISNIQILSNKHLILKSAYKIYTKENFFAKKPNPECYLKIINEFTNEGYTKFIGFEDSLPGIHALYQVSQITPIFINTNEYYYTDYIIKNYPNIINIKNYDLTILNNLLTSKSQQLKINNEYNFINHILEHNINELNKNKHNMNHIINSISTILKNSNPNNNIYLSGMGKSGYICKKSASTWQSLAIKASYIDLPNLPHGDFGIFKNNDILLLISNGGNTNEVINILKYIKYNLTTKINIISIIAHKNSEMEKYSNITYILNEITEADTINMTPSTSSIIFMTILDAIAINIKKNITKDEFQMFHPSGSLGKK